MVARARTLRTTQRNPVLKSHTNEQTKQQQQQQQQKRHRTVIPNINDHLPLRTM